MSNSNSPQSWVTKVDVKLAEKMMHDLGIQGFEITIPAHTCFSAKKQGVTCTLYQTGKLVVQGKEKDALIEFYLEPEILGSFAFTNPLLHMDLTPRIGIDESGKGDFFGPLCIAGVYAASEENFAFLEKTGIKDSKKMADALIRKVASKIQAHCCYHIVRINPTRYNEIYAQFKNLNRLLAWGHATVIEQLVQKSGCVRVIVDQFAGEELVLTALKRKKIKIDLTQRHRAEEDLVVAAASILARNAFLEGLEKLSQEVGVLLPKGAAPGAILLAAQKIKERWGPNKLFEVCKQHFKTFNSISDL